MGEVAKRVNEPFSIAEEGFNRLLMILISLGFKIVFKYNKNLKE